MWLKSIQEWARSFEKYLDGNKDKDFSKLAFDSLKINNWSKDYKLDYFVKDFYQADSFPKQFKPNSQFGNPPLDPLLF